MQPAPHRRTGQPQASLALFVAAAIGFAALAAYFANNPYPTAIDAAAEEFLQRVNPQRGFQWGDSEDETAVDYAIMSIFDAGIVIAAWKYGTPQLGGLAALSVLGNQGVVRIVKSLVERPRPGEAFSTTGAFPSGHVTHVTLAVLLFLLIVLPLLRRKQIALGIPQRDRAYAAALIVLFATYRVFSGEHWVTDVIGGVLLGLAWALGTQMLARAWLEKG